ncbi:hypothetical protein ACE1BU_07650 [Aeromonas veronii]|uniref:restriction endonuclease subunit S n=1 Tax=Aeromonas veronii TaxID=654 RepID=UPI0035B8A11D
MIAAEPKTTGQYQPYPEYKNTGLTWLGAIPNHWGLKMAKFVFKRVQRPVRVEDDIVTAFRDGQVTLRSNRRTEGFTNALQEIGYQGVRSGDLLIHAMDGFAGAIGISDSEGKCSPVCSVCIPISAESVNPYYYGYLVRQLAVTGFITSLSKGIRERSTEFRFSEFSPLELALPPVDEQHIIAAFLDYETARIDRLIAQQQRLIELLKEKRQAVISHAVTKGLNPNAPMKDSGVEWLGQVPEHWIVRRLKHHIISMDQGWSPQCEARLAEENEFGVMKVGCVNGGVFRFSEHKALPAELEPKTEYCLKKGQLLVSRANTRELVGSAAVVDADYDQLLLCDKLYRIKLSSDASPEFVALLLGTSAYRGQIELSASGASDSMQNIGQSTIKELPIAVPPMDEANDILKYVAARLCTFDCLNNQLQQQNLLLQERRTALISAAVTGKIDLRGWTPPADEVAA